MKITIMRDQLIAALCTAAKGDIRFYLNGVYIEASNMETRLVSTTGALVAVQRADAKDENEVDGVLKMIIPRTAVEKIKSHKTLRTVELNDEGGKWGIVDCATRTTFDPVDGVFPDYRRAIPDKATGKAARFNPEFIAMFAKASKALGTSQKGSPVVKITPNGDDAALVSVGRDDEYFGVLMPMRDELTDTTPVWAKADLAALAPEVAEDLV